MASLDTIEAFLPLAMIYIIILWIVFAILSIIYCVKTDWKTWKKTIWIIAICLTPIGFILYPLIYFKGWKKIAPIILYFTPIIILYMASTSAMKTTPIYSQKNSHIEGIKEEADSNEARIAKASAIDAAKSLFTLKRDTFEESLEKNKGIFIDFISNELHPNYLHALERVGINENSNWEKLFFEPDESKSTITKTVSAGNIAEWRVNIIGNLSVETNGQTINSHTTISLELAGTEYDFSVLNIFIQRLPQIPQ